MTTSKRIIPTPHQELEVEVRERRERALASFFKVQHAFFTENIHAPPVKGYDHLKYQRLIYSTQELLTSLEQWQKSALKYVDLVDAYRKKPDFPENNTSPGEIASEYHRVHPSADGVHHQKGSS